MRRAFVVVFGALWLAAILIGTSLLLSYENTPAMAAIAPVRWPSQSSLELGADGHTLIMFAHPRCSCTEASVMELADLMKQSAGSLKAYVLFLQPAGTDDTWSHAELWTLASAIPGVTVLADPEGREASCFRTGTSGHVVVYDGRGHLQFDGGITPARGQTGDQAWRSTLLAMVGPKAESFHAAPVFGCSFCEPESKTSEERVP